MKVKPYVTLFSLLIIGIAAFIFVSLRSGGKGLSNNKTSTHVSKENTPIITTEKNQLVFDYQPEVPVNGTLKGVVEIGATGFNSFIINVDSAKRWEIVAKDFGTSLIYEGLTSSDELTNRINNYLSKIFDHAVEEQNIHFVVSSGAQKESKTTAIIEELNGKGFDIKLISPESEANYGYFAAVPTSFRENAFFVDIGSGNTKVAWQTDGKIFTQEAAGSKYYQTVLTDTGVYREVQSVGQGIPEKNRAFCFFLGGVPFEMAKQTRKGEERYTILNLPQSYKASDRRMQAGLNIYKALFEATGCKFFVFDWDANFAVGYLLNTK